MRPILRQTALLLLFLVLLYGLALALAVPATSRPATGGLDTASARHTVFMTEPKYAFLTRGRLDDEDDKAILLGASNVLAGFRPLGLQGLVPTATVHNLAIGGANMTEVRQMVDLVLEAQGTAAQRHNLFVIGIWYGLFADDRARWYTPDRHPGDTDLDIERYRYGFYRRGASGPVPLLPPRWLDQGVSLIAPFLQMDRLARQLARAVRPGTSLATAAASPGGVPDPARQRQYLAFWDGYMGGGGRLSEAPFATLAATVERIRASGGRVLIVDLPLPRWHARASPYDASYRHHWQTLQPRLAALPGVTCMSLRDADRPEDFSDEVHPRPPVAARWAQRLADALNAAPIRVARQ